MFFLSKRWSYYRGWLVRESVMSYYIYIIHTFLSVFL